MGDEPGGADSSDTKRVSLSMPESTFDRLLAGGPVDGDIQDALKRAVWNQIERDEADEYTVVKNRE